METISVHDIVLDRGLNPRQHGVDQDVVEFYTAIFNDVVWPPILVDRATHKLLDGWHRVEAAQRAGVYSLPVQWVDAKEEELFALAVKANLGHGVRLSREERYRAIVRLQRESWTPERIVEFLGCSPAMVEKSEKAEDLRIDLKVHDLPGALLPIETLVEVSRLPQEYHRDVAELACEADAKAADVRRAVRAIKKGVVDTNEEIQRTMTDPEFAKTRLAQAKDKENGNWLMTFAGLIDQFEMTQIRLDASEREAAVALFRRMRTWADQQLVRLGEKEEQLGWEVVEQQ